MIDLNKFCSSVKSEILAENGCAIETGDADWYAIMYMMARKIFFPVLLFMIFFPACNNDNYTISEGASKIVVEGWIDEGDVARVLLSRSIPMTDIVDSANIIRYAIRSAMVIVTDGEIYDTLRLTSAPRYFPPFLYVGNKIVGKTDGKYTLIVKYLDRTITAETVIPPSVPIDNVFYVRNNPADTVGNVVVEFTNPADKQNYFQIATMLEGHDNIFVPCLYANFNSRNFASPDVSIQITRGVTIFPQTNFEMYFKDGDRIRVRLRTMTKEGFDFWNIWQNEIINAQNAVFPANTNLKSNINGAIGIWCGYGQSTMRITAR